MKYLVVAAHPDDEALGAGGTLYNLKKNSDEVDICIMSGKAEARAFRPGDEELSGDMEESFRILGINKAYIGDFPNIRFNTVPHLELVKHIENAILESKPDIVITHHACDTNNDHMHTSLACQAAVRLFQRREDVYPVSELWFMEVPSSTEWSVNNSMNKFSPDTFFEIGEDGLECKLKALGAYRGVKRPYPHPRSDEAIRGLAAFRGSQSGCLYAESFETAFRRIAPHTGK
ncbi:MAG: PIG-L family deacetylase [Clostridia bacterium]|nr:PIG-L family deacetylase [Clostridia bacterium]